MVGNLAPGLLHAYCKPPSFFGRTKSSPGGLYETGVPLHSCPSPPVRQSTSAQSVCPGRWCRTDHVPTTVAWSESESPPRPWLRASDGQGLRLVVPRCLQESTKTRAGLIMGYRFDLFQTEGKLCLWAKHQLLPRDVAQLPEALAPACWEKSHCSQQSPQGPPRVAN